MKNTKYGSETYFNNFAKLDVHKHKWVNELFAKWLENLKHIIWYHTTSRRQHRENLFDICLGSNFLKMTTEAKETKAKWTSVTTSYWEASDQQRKKSKQKEDNCWSGRIYFQTYYPRKMLISKWYKCVQKF